MSMLLKVPLVHWDENESTGYRHVTVSYKGNNVMSVLAHYQNNSWQGSIVPMGYSYNSHEVQEFIEFFNVLPNLIKYLETDSVLTADMVNDFIHEKLYKMNVQ